MKKETRESKGSPIPGSRFVRAYCTICHEPIRVPKDDLCGPHYCSRCDGHLHMGGGGGGGTDDTSPSWDNAVRAMEEG
ncbi:MAG: hypothetical protein V2A79_14805 [Planctomycetota bacterium]